MSVTMIPRRTDAHLALVERVREYIDLHTDEPLPLARLAREAGVSPAHLQRTFTRVVGLSPKQYQEQRRVGALKSALREGRTVSSATYEAGFGTGRRVYEAADESLGMTPGTYRRRGVGVTIHYTVVPVSLGLLLVAVTERGICSVSLGDDEASLVAALRAELPGAELVRATDARDRLVDAVVAWGDEETIVSRVRAHLDAGADHVCVQVLDPDRRGLPAPQWRRLASALL